MGKVRKLGLVTGIAMLVLLFFAGIPPVEFWILRLPTDGSALLSPGGDPGMMMFFLWGYSTGGTYVSMLLLQFPDCLVAWVTTIPYMIAIGFTLAASTPGSVPKNAKRFFSLSGIFCILHLSFYLLIILFSSYNIFFYLFLGPGFYALLLFAVSSFISFAKVQ